MINISSTEWSSFKAELQQHPELVLQFQYAPGKWVNANYHITEIKQAPIVSVDCGGVMNAWTEIIVQLWEPTEEETGRAMQVKKALSIINLVESKLPLSPNGIVKIEFGNSAFDTRQMFPGEFKIDGENLILDLSPDATQCKAINRGGSCGTTETGEECCAPPQPEKTKIKLVNLAAGQNSCTPESGCC
ncbi:hypothetical protein EZ456_11100 [Pedobacter psychrodurus]|uniref:Uncharacterized protein n=1 Tax=Pedobacter psychrodurus TaxID=2530456 RepID=A0A4R0PWG3_9SPHI|nr:DUF6428 family protein [Pedobacter psychrodurus]TCD27062.1 hypothetical protein EZ456_11100 [Pedobacter psychrodurus]